ncbi:hypothetical protein [Paracoccus sp. J55]|uniref:hypothetical protein n=1 Tax=Paracoccus sp. J55 TaxID=935849 RepID=UPI0018DC4D38|nr:hypothetical protein [Paracoccus sp. J55]
MPDTASNDAGEVAQDTFRALARTFGRASGQRFVQQLASRAGMGSDDSTQYGTLRCREREPSTPSMALPRLDIDHDGLLLSSLGRQAGRDSFDRNSHPLGSASRRAFSFQGSDMANYHTLFSMN